MIAYIQHIYVHISAILKLMGHEQPVLLCLLLISLHLYIQVESRERGYISVEISNKGINFVKDLVIGEALSSLTPLQLPQIQEQVKIPVIGKVEIVLSDITINNIDLSFSTIKTGDSGITILASNATADISLSWRYSYSSWLFVISDQGDASIQVEGMEVGVTLNLINEQGNLKLLVLECGCYVQDILINLNGGASWLYQGVAGAFKENIISSVEDAVSSKINDGMIKVDSLLMSLPKDIPLDNIAAINFTFVNDPVISKSSIELEVDGLFTANDETAVSNILAKPNEDTNSCKELDKMIWISLHEKVLHSAVLVYFKANAMQWTVDQLPDQALLNTAEWKYVIPQLYRKFPNDAIKLYISINSPPSIKIKVQNIEVTVDLDITVAVEDFGEVIPVACISTMFSASGFARISRRKLAGRVKLRDFTMDLKWSKIGHLRMTIIKSFVSASLRTVVLPYVNILLWEGFALPVFHGYELRNAEIISGGSKIMICSDVASTS